MIDRATFQSLDPTLWEPHGDRYLVEKIPIENVHVTPDGTRIHIDGTTDMEEKHGFFVGRIIRGGDGYRMESDTYVKMPYFPGDVVMIERFTGRELQMQSRTYRMVSQVDILAKSEEMSPDRSVRFHEAQELTINASTFLEA